MDEFENLREENISAGFRTPFYGTLTELPLCNVCVFRYAPGKCKKKEEVPIELCNGDSHDCPDAILNTGKFIYPVYKRLHPDVCEKAKKQE